MFEGLVKSPIQTLVEYPESSVVTCVGVPGPQSSVQAGGVDHPGVEGGDTLPPVLVALQQSEIIFSTPFQKELKFQPKKVTNFLCN